MADITLKSEQVAYALYLLAWAIGFFSIFVLCLSVTLSFAVLAGAEGAFSALIIGMVGVGMYKK